MKISFRQELVAAVSALLLFSSTGAWAVCESELEAAIIASRDRTDERYQRDWHRQVIATKDFPKATQGSDAGKYVFAWFVIDGKDISSGLMTVGDKKTLLEFLESTLRKNTNPQSKVDVLARYRQRQFVERAVTEVEYQNCISAFILGENTRPSSATSTSNLSPSSKTQQQAAQSPQQQAALAQQLAQQNQTRADQSRQGKRRRHEPENEASQCIQPDFGGLYGGMQNTCNFKVWYTYCGYRPKENSWLTGMNCEKQKFGSDSVGPGRTSAAHTHGVEMLYWFACKEPAWTVDTEFVPGQGIRGRCHTVGGN